MSRKVFGSEEHKKSAKETLWNKIAIIIIVNTIAKGIKITLHFEKQW